MEKRTVTIDFDELEMAMQDRDVSWCIDPATGNTCLESEEAELLHGADDAELMRPTDPDDVLELPPLLLIQSEVLPHSACLSARVARRRREVCS